MDGVRQALDGEVPCESGPSSFRRVDSAFERAASRRREQVERRPGSTRPAPVARASQRLRPSWSGLDPITCGRRCGERPGGRFVPLGISCPVPRSRIEALRLYAMRPARQSLFGVEQRTAQAGTRLRGGGRRMAVFGLPSELGPWHACARPSPSSRCWQTATDHGCPSGRGTTTIRGKRQPRRWTVSATTSAPR